jgi:hypothetical protein
MDGTNIRVNLFPAIVGTDKPGTVQSFGEMIKGAGEFLLIAVGNDISDSPGFVKRHPTNDRRVIYVPTDKRGPFMKNMPARFGTKPISAGHLPPYKEPLNIGPIIKKGSFDFLM